MVYNPRGMNKHGGLYAPLYYTKDNKMILGFDILLIIEYAIGILIVAGIIMAPAWVARQNGKGKPDMYAVRLASWVFGWSIIGWIWALYWATKK